MALKYLGESNRTFITYCLTYMVKLCATTETVVLHLSLVSGHIQLGQK